MTKDEQHSATEKIGFRCYSYMEVGTLVAEKKGFEKFIYSLMARPLHPPS